MENFSSTHIVCLATPELEPVFIIVERAKIRDAPLMESVNKKFATRLATWFAAQRSTLSSKDSWAKGNGERHTAVSAGDAGTGNFIYY